MVSFPICYLRLQQDMAANGTSASFRHFFVWRWEELGQPEDSERKWQVKTIVIVTLDSHTGWLAGLVLTKLRNPQFPDG